MLLPDWLSNEVNRVALWLYSHWADWCQLRLTKTERVRSKQTGNNPTQLNYTQLGVELGQVGLGRFSVAWALWRFSTHVTMLRVATKFGRQNNGCCAKLYDECSQRSRTDDVLPSKWFQVKKQLTLWPCRYVYVFLLNYSAYLSENCFMPDLRINIRIIGGRPLCIHNKVRPDYTPSKH